MRILIPLLFVCCFFACTKYSHEGSSSSSGSRDYYYEGLAKVLKVDKTCGDEQPILLEFLGGTWNSSFSYTHDFTAKNEFWSYGIPDSFKAVGQYLNVTYQPVETYRRKKCFSTIHPNQIRFDHISIFWDWPIIQVLEINSNCGGMTLVKLDKYFIDSYGADRVWVVNLPDSLKFVGKRLDCYMRHAGIHEIIKCNSATPYQQVVIRNIFPL